ncbi:MAG: hypothetical protein U0167_06850 [bacterium]
MAASRPSLRQTIGYWALLAAVSLWVLAIFLRPALHHVGINDYERSRFVPMVEGTAYEPYVQRALLPLVIRGLSALVPEGGRAALTRTVEAHLFLHRVFAKLHWEPAQAHRYLLASLLMLLSYVGFAHLSARLAIVTSGLTDDLRTRALIGVPALLGLPPFLIYTSFLYDPVQLFLFAAALFLLATRQIAKFAGLFPLCCLNKETAVLLIPIFALMFRDLSPRSRYLGTLAWLVICYVAVKATLILAFRANPGAVVEQHLFDHNFHWLTRPWTLADLLGWSGVGWLLLFRWREKPRLLTTSFVCILPPLVAFALVLGYVDEWRGYYEAYPVAVGLVTDTLRRFRPVLLSGSSAG